MDGWKANLMSGIQTADISNIFTRLGSGHYRRQFRYVPRQIMDSDGCTFLYLLIKCKDLHAAH